MRRMLWVFAAVAGCVETKVCGPCDEEAGLVFCTDCPTTETCISSIEEEESGEVVYECETAPGESCITDQLVAMCPDV